MASCDAPDPNSCCVDQDCRLGATVFGKECPAQKGVRSLDPDSSVPRMTVPPGLQRICPTPIIFKWMEAEKFYRDQAWCFGCRSQVDGQNLTNTVNVIDFGGLFSGSAIDPSRSFALRLTTNF